MVLYGAMAMRRRARRKEQETTSALSGSEYESERVGNSRRRRKRVGCKHDPYAQELAQIIVSTYDWIAKSTPIKANLSNGLENTTWSSFCATEKSIFLGMLLVRLLNYAAIQTYYVADEYWQSVEVAHHEVFQGHLTWEWKEGIRGYFYPAIFSFVYKILLVFGLDSREMVVRLPRLLQTVAAAVGDLYLYKLSKKVSNEKVAQWSLLCQTLSWFIFYCSTRTLTNSMETVLVTAALYYYPWSAKVPAKEVWKFLWLAALAVIVRPTAAIIFVPICICHILISKNKLWSTAILYTVTALLFLFISMRVDKSFYGRWILVPWNFFNFNITKKISAFYGTHPWYWYITQGLPFMLSTHLIPLMLGWRRCKNRSLQALFVYTVCIYSVLPHKEFRFLLPILPLAMHFCGYYMTTLCQEIAAEQIAASDALTTKDSAADVDSGLTTDASQGESAVSDSDKPIKSMKLQLARSQQRWITPKALLYLLLIGNIPLMLYFSTMHQRGALDVTKFLHTESVRNPNMSVLFLTPCHATPYHSHIHNNITMRFLTCEPNFNGVEEYEDEADVFFNDPVHWLKKEVVKGTNRHVYSHIVMFETLERDVMNFLKKGKYQRCAKYFYAHWIDDRRRSKNLLVFCR